jgi:hypothetical protein
VLHVPSRFVTVVVMTVSGKGGRPRKWRSDADRQRAFRARQKGEAEPPTLARALDDGDELAVALERIRFLELAVEREREIASEQARVAREANEALELLRRQKRPPGSPAPPTAGAAGGAASVAELVRERDSLREQLIEARRLIQMRQSSNPSEFQARISRAERRRREREERRRRDT